MPFSDDILSDLVECLLGDSVDMAGLPNRYAAYERILKESMEESLEANSSGLHSTQEPCDQPKDFADEMLGNLELLPTSLSDSQSVSSNNAKPPLEPMETLRFDPLVAQSPAFPGSIHSQTAYTRSTDLAETRSAAMSPKEELKPGYNGCRNKPFKFDVKHEVAEDLEVTDLAMLHEFIQASQMCATNIMKLFEEEGDANYAKAHSVVRTLFEERIKSFGQVKVGVLAREYMVKATTQKFFESYYKEIGVPNNGSIRLLQRGTGMEVNEIRRWFEDRRDRLISLEPYLERYRHERRMQARAEYGRDWLTEDNHKE